MRILNFIIALVILATLMSDSAFAPPPKCPSLDSQNVSNVCVGTGTKPPTTGTLNTAVGTNALAKNSSGVSNTAIGWSSLTNLTSGQRNTAVGVVALQTADGSFDNTSIGYNASGGITTGLNNIALGSSAGSSVTSGSDNIHIGNSGENESNKIRIGTSATHTATYIAGIYNKTGGSTAKPVCIDDSGKLFNPANGNNCPTNSSRRYKEEIEPMGNASDKLLKLRPVTYYYKKANPDGTKPLQYGLIAEEVDEILPEMVIRNQDGLPDALDYSLLPKLLLNEYQKQHNELEATKAELATTKTKMAEMQSQIESLNDITKKLMAALPATSKSTKTAMVK